MSSFQSTKKIIDPVRMTKELGTSKKGLSFSAIQGAFGFANFESKEETERRLKREQRQLSKNKPAKKVKTVSTGKSPEWLRPFGPKGPIRPKNQNVVAKAPQKLPLDISEPPMYERESLQKKEIGDIFISSDDQDENISPEPVGHATDDMADVEQETPIGFQAPTTGEEKGFPLYFKSIVAWVLDSVLSMALFVACMATSRVIVESNTLPPSLIEIQNLSIWNSIYSFIGISHFSTVLLSTLPFAILLFFLSQFMLCLISGMTPGRFAVGFHLKHTGLFVHLLAGALMGLIQFLTLGGLLALPFIILFPTRVPLFFWERFYLRKAVSVE